MECCECSIKSTKPLQCKTCKTILCSSQCLIHHIPKHHKTTSHLTHHSTKEIHSSSTKPKVTKTIKSKYLTEGTFITNTNLIPTQQFLMNPITSKTGTNIILGSGTFGHVVMERNVLDNKIYAVKYMDKSKLINLIGSLNQIYNEIDIHSRLHHDNIIRLYKCKETKHSFELIMEYANCGNLFHYIKHKRGLNEKEAFKFFIQVCNAVLFLHRNNLIHRDLKPENILLIDNDKVKLCDFGWCAKISNEQNRNTYCGTLEYMAPEMVNEQQYNKAIDIWSLGILLYELIHNYSPFRASNANNKEEIVNNIKKHEITFKANVSKECKELINAMLCANDNERITIEDIFVSDFVKKYERDNEYKNVKSKTIDVDRVIIPKGNINENETHESNNSIIINYSEEDSDNNGCIDNDEELDNVSLELCIKQQPHSLRNQNRNNLNINGDTLKETEEWINQNNNNNGSSGVGKGNKLTKSNALNTIHINFQRAKCCLNNNLFPKKKQTHNVSAFHHSMDMNITNINKQIHINETNNKINNIFFTSHKDNNTSNDTNNSNNNIKKIYKKFKLKNYSKSIDTTNYKLNTINVSQTQTRITNNNNYVSQLSTKPNSIISHKILFETINIVNNSKRNIT